MLKYLYSTPTNKTKITKIIEHKIINEQYTNKFYIRSSILENKEILILDNNYSFFLINKKNIEKYLNLFKEKNILGKALQLTNFVYLKKNYFKMFFFIKKQFYKNSTAYLKILFLLQKSIQNSININWLLLLVSKGNFLFYFNGLKGFLPKKKFNKFKKIFKKLKKSISLKQKSACILKTHKKLIIKSLLLKNLKANKMFITKNKYKNQPIKLSVFPKNKKPFIKNVK